MSCGREREIINFAVFCVIREENPIVFEREVECDDAKKDDKGNIGDAADRATGFTGQLVSLGCTGLFYTLIGCTGLQWAFLCYKGFTALHRAVMDYYGL